MGSAASTSLGSSLREERLRQNLDLAAITSRTRICPAILQAIEDDRFETIPGGAYRRHFVRQYAGALGLDPEAAIAEFLQQYQEAPLPLPTPPKKRRSRLWADLAWAGLFLVCIGATHQVIQNPRSWMKRQERASAGREVTRQAEPRGSANRASEPPAGPAPPPAAATPAGAATPDATATPVAAATASAPVPEAAPVHVAFTATEPVWVSVKCDGTVAFAGVLAALNSRTFDAAAAVTAVIGNAGGLIVTLNGRALGPLGARGEVQTVELTLNGARRIARRVVQAADGPQL